MGTLRLVLAGTLLVLLSGCRPGIAPKTDGEPDRAEVTPIPVVLDTDIGSDIDDTWALALLLKSPELDLKMVLCATGDTEYRCRVAARFLEVAQRTDVPVGLGPSGESPHEYQRPWVEGYSLDQYPGTVHRDGVAAFLDLVHRSETPITLIAIGPLPNVAEALRRDPSIASKVHFIGMQGSIDRGYGTDPPAAEANVVSDVDAFRKVLQADWLSFRITPLDTAGVVMVGGDNYQELRAADQPMLQALLENYRIWADLVTWVDVDFYDQRSSTLFDIVAIYMAYGDEYLEYETVPIRVTNDGYTKRDDEGVPIRAAMHWKDLQAFEDHVTRRLLAPSQ